MFGRTFTFKLASADVSTPDANCEQYLAGMHSQLVLKPEIQYHSSKFFAPIYPCHTDHESEELPLRDGAFVTSSFIRDQYSFFMLASVHYFGQLGMLCLQTVDMRHFTRIHPKILLTCIDIVLCGITHSKISTQGRCSHVSPFSLAWNVNARSFAGGFNALLSRIETRGRRLAHTALVPLLNALNEVRFVLRADYLMSIAPRLSAAVGTHFLALDDDALKPLTRATIGKAVAFAERVLNTVWAAGTSVGGASKMHTPFMANILIISAEQTYSPKQYNYTFATSSSDRYNFVATYKCEYSVFTL